MSQLTAATPVDSHLFTGVDYIFPSAEEFELKTQRFERDLERLYGELEVVHKMQEWRCDPRYKSWHDYCQQRFQFTGRYGYNKIAAARVNTVLLEHGRDTLKERQARVVSDLPAPTILAVREKAQELSQSAELSGLAARYHKAGKITSRLMEKARKEVVPDAPHPVDVEAAPPLPPKKPLEGRPRVQPIRPINTSKDIAHFGKVFLFEIDGEHYQFHCSASEFAEFFPADTEL